MRGDWREVGGGMKGRWMEDGGRMAGGRKEAGGKLGGEWRETGGRLEGGWREASGRPEGQRESGGWSILLPSTSIWRRPRFQTKAHAGLTRFDMFSPRERKNT